MKTLTFALTAQQPLLMTSFQGDPNSDVSYSYIPGSTLRGALIGRYLRQSGNPPFDPVEPSIHRLFFDDDSTHYLNGYVSDHSGHRTLPVPYSWLREKTESLSPETDCPVYNMAVSPTSPNTPKHVGEGFWCEEGSGTEIYRSRRRMNIHTQRDRAKGRATKDNGQVFRYESIEAGAVFRCAITCHDNDVKPLKALLNQSSTLWIGGSRSAGYGKTTLSDVETKDNWQEAPGNRPTDSALVVTLLSHTLLRDDNGQPVTDAAAVRSAMNTVLPTLTLPAHNPSKTFLKRETIGGFNRKWGLPLPQRVAIAQGSVITFENVTLTEEQRRQIETVGIGERRIEGFGRVAINYGLFTYKPNVRLAAANRTQTASVQPKNIGIAKEVAKRIFSQRLEQALFQEVSRNKLEKNQLSNSQLSRLELAARRGLQQHSLVPVQQLLEKENLTKTALRQFERSRLNKRPFYDQLEDWATRKPFDWLESYNGSNELAVTISDNVTCNLSDDDGKEIATEYTLRLIMAVAKQAKKEKAS